MPFDESFAVTTGDGSTYVVGGSSSTSTTVIIDRYGFADDPDQAEFHWRFVVEASGADDLATKCAAMEDALRQRYSSLRVYFGSSIQLDYEPDVNATPPATGWDLEPSLKKVEGWLHTAKSRAYDYRARVALPPNFTDAYGPANGRRSASANYHFDVNERPVVQLVGVWTQVPGFLARPQFLSAIEAYANYRLTLIDPTAAWTITRREEKDEQSLTTLTWSREFSQVIAGRRGSTRDPVIQASGLRIVTVRGTYLNTYGMTPLTATQNYAADVQTQVDALLAAIPAVEGGALVIGTNCEVVTKNSPTNEQDDRLDFSWVIRELRVGQSLVATGNVLDDPNIVLDSIVLSYRLTPLSDSPAPPPVAASTPNSPSVPVSSPAPGSLNAGGGHTFTRPAPPTPPVGSAPSSPSSTLVVKPIDVFARYEATFKASLPDLASYYNTAVYPLLLKSFSSALSVTPVVVVDHQPQVDIQNCKVSAGIHAQAYPGSLIGLEVTDSYTDDMGLRFDGAFTGTPRAFLVQPGLPDSVRLRSINAIYLTGSAFQGVSQWFSPAWTPGQTGWVLFRRSRPKIVTRVVGIPGIGLGTISLTSEAVIEEFRLVDSNVGGGVGGVNPPSGAASTLNNSASSPTGTTGSGNTPGGPLAVPMPTATGG